MASKRYVANNRDSLLIILALPEKRQASIEFIPGYSLRREGYFITSNETLQQALEEDARFGKKYRLAEIDGMLIEEYNARKALGLKDKSVEKEGQTEKSFKTVQQARDWLNREHNIPFTVLGNKARITEKACELGFQLTFETDQNNQEE